MAGSRKGERRGGARLGHRPTFQPKTGKIRAQKPKKGKAGRPTGSRNLISGEQEREMIEIITGKSELMPKEVQLTAMRELFGLAREYQTMMMGAMKMLPTLEMPQTRINASVSFAEEKMVQYLMLASQVARDAAPFIHPRLAAIAVKTDRTETRDLFDLLLEEIDQTPRIRVIEQSVVEVDDNEETEAA